MTRLLVFLFLLFAGSASAQQRDIFLELGGSGGIASINYEHFFKKCFFNHTDGSGDDGASPFRYSMRYGFSTTPVDKNNGWVLVFPTLMNLVYGNPQQPHRLEIGAGLAPSVTTKGSFYIKSPLFIGYRFQPVEKKIFLRAGYTPIVGWLVDFQWQHWAGISLGYNIGGNNENK